MIRTCLLALVCLAACTPLTTSDSNDPCSKVKGGGGVGSECSSRTDCAQMCCPCSQNPQKKFGASSCNTTSRQCEQPDDLCAQVEAADPTVCDERG